MIVLEEAHNIAVSLGKSENMRVTAGRMFATMVKYVHSPDNDGAKQVMVAGYDPDVPGCWKMVAADEAFPPKLGKSFSTGRKLLSIGKAPDPVKAEEEARAADAERKTPVTNPPGNPGNNVTEQLNIGVGSTEVDEWQAPPREVDPVEALKAATKRLGTEAGKSFFFWHVGEGRALGWVK